MRTVIVRNVPLTSTSERNSLGLHAYCIHLGLLSASPIGISGAIASLSHKYLYQVKLIGFNLNFSHRPHVCRCLITNIISTKYADMISLRCLRTNWHSCQLNGYHFTCYTHLNINSSKVSHENRALLLYYAASSSSSLPTFRDNLSVPSSRVKSPRRMLLTAVCGLYKEGYTRVTGCLLGLLTLDDGTDKLSRNVCKELSLLAA
jgi:hypothetical protein